jgi:hypothetical protein
MRSSSLIRLGSLAAIVGGVASTMLGLLYVLQAQGVTLGSSPMPSSEVLAYAIL